MKELSNIRIDIYANTTMWSTGESSKWFIMSFYNYILKMKVDKENNF